MMMTTPRSHEVVTMLAKVRKDTDAVRHGTSAASSHAIENAINANNGQPKCPLLQKKVLTLLRPLLA